MHRPGGTPDVGPIHKPNSLSPPLSSEQPKVATLESDASTRSNGEGSALEEDHADLARPAQYDYSVVDCHFHDDMVPQLRLNRANRELNAEVEDTHDSRYGCVLQHALQEAFTEAGVRASRRP